MKNTITFFVCLLFALPVFAQDELLDIPLSTMGGIEVTVSDIVKENKVPVLFLTWESPGDMSRFISKILSDHRWKEEIKKRDLKVLAVNVDRYDDLQEVKTYAREQGWPVEVLKDHTGELGAYLAQKGSVKVGGLLMYDRKKIKYTDTKYGMNGFEFRTVLMPAPPGEKLMIVNANDVFHITDWQYANWKQANHFKTVDKAGDHYYLEKRLSNGALDYSMYFKDPYLLVIDSVYTSYTPTGKLSKLANYKDGALHGELKDWNYDGQLIAHEFYDNGRFVGKRQTFYDNGKQKEISNWINGEKDGAYRRWYKNGQLEVEEIYDRGRLMEVQQYFSKTGKALKTGHFSNGNGTLYTYRDDGTRFAKYEYQDGLRHGEAVYYDVNGKVKSTGRYVKGVKQ